MSSFLFLLNFAHQILSFLILWKKKIRPNNAFLGVQQRFFINFLNFLIKKFKNSDSQQPIFQLAQKHNIFIGGMKSKYPAGHDVRNTQIGQYNCCYRQNSITGFLHNWFIVVDSFVVPVILVLEPSPFNHRSGFSYTSYNVHFLHNRHLGYGPRWHDASPQSHIWIFILFLWCRFLQKINV